MSAWPSADNRRPQLCRQIPAVTPHGCANWVMNRRWPADFELRDLVIHGLIYMVPLAPIGVFGIIYDMSAGAVAAVYVVAAFAMWFSAISYNEMAQCFPVSGSTYSRHPLREAAPQSQVVRPCGLPDAGRCDPPGRARGCGHQHQDRRNMLAHRRSRGSGLLRLAGRPLDRSEV